MRTAIAIAAFLLVPLSARAEIAVFANGTTMTIESHAVADGRATLRLRGGGTIEMAMADVDGFVPDEVYEEVLREAPADAVPEVIRALAREAAKRHGVNADLVAAVIAVESNFNAGAVSPKGARGLMQLMPGTAASLGVDDSFDPEKNVDGGSRYLRELLLRYDGDSAKALAAYNAGPGAVKRHGGVPPYRETRSYIRKVLQKYQAEASAAKGAGGS